jgi:Ni/Co efflux regulator RcnB
MKKVMIRAAAILSAGSFVLSAIPLTAQDRHYDNHGDHNDRDQHSDHHDQSRHRWHNYGGQYGYNGYHGPWRTGQRYTHYNDDHYVITDYRAYDLPPPRPGYRYYREDNGDVVMAAIAGGMIGLILGNTLNDDHYHH